jgi:hypothetical protein
MKKYNNSTGCYKIDIYVEGVYYCSTDQSKTCKAAKKRFSELHPKIDIKLIKCFYYKY